MSTEVVGAIPAANHADLVDNFGTFVTRIPHGQDRMGSSETHVGRIEKLRDVSCAASDLNFDCKYSRIFGFVILLGGWWSMFIG